MLPKMSIRRKLFISFSVIFIMFTILVLLFQYQREKDFRTGQLENTLDNITELTHQFIAENAISESGYFQDDRFPGENPSRTRRPGSR